MSPSQAGDQDHREAGTIITREAPMGEHFVSRASVVTTIWDDSTKIGRASWREKKSVKNQRGMLALLLFLCLETRSQNLAGEIHKHLI